MKYLIAISFAFQFYSLSGQSEHIIGEYYNQENYVIIAEGNWMKFKITSGDSPSIGFYGEGFFVIDDNTVILDATRPDNREHSYYVITDTIDKHQIKFQVTSDSGPVTQCNIIAKNSTNRIIAGAVTSERGEATLKLAGDVSVDGIISISEIKYDKFDISLDSVLGRSVHVILASYVVFDDTRIVFNTLLENDQIIIDGPYLTEHRKIIHYNPDTSIVEEYHPAPIHFSK